MICTYNYYFVWVSSSRYKLLWYYHYVIIVLRYV